MYKKLLNTTSKVIKGKFIRNLVLIVGAVLVVFDVILVVLPEYPTISQTIAFASLKWMVVTYIFGLAISNIFFLRKVSEQPNRVFPILIISSICAILLYLGCTVHGNLPDYNCSNFQNFEQEKYPFTYLVCNEEPTDIPAKIKDVESFKRYNSEVQDCSTLVCLDNHSFRVDMSLWGKIILVFLGIISGHFLWPEFRTFKPK